MRRFLVVAVAGLALAGCEFNTTSSGGDTSTSSGAARPAANAFSHSQSDDISGEYRVVGEASGNRLGRLYLGQAADFEAWEGGRRSGGFAPVMLEIERDGGVERILPETYAVSDGRIRMTGQSDSLGPVTFDGRLDKGALATARRNLGDDETPAMTASVTIAGATHSGLKLSWYGGD